MEDGDARKGAEDDRARLDAALVAAGVPAGDVVDRRRLSGGTFNAVFSVRRADGDRLVVKLAPGPSVPVMRHERGLLGTEAHFYALVQKAVDVPVPAVLGPAAAGDALVMTHCPGRTWHEAAGLLDGGRRRRLRAELGRHVAALHTVTGPEFGYPSRSVGPLRGSWRAAFTDMVDAVLTDAERFGVRLPRPASLVRRLFAARGSVLDDVTTASLVHFDLWDGNILVEGADGPEPGIGALIDAERAFWGDPLADFVSLALFGDIESDDAFLAGYRSAGGTAVFDASARRRLELYRTYLYLIMWVEAVPRAYGAERLAWLREQVLAPLAATLDGWAGERRR